MYLCSYVHMSAGNLQSPEKGVRSLGTGVTSNSKAIIVSAGN